MRLKDACHIEELFGMLPGESDELVYIGTDGLHPSLHGRNGVALPLKADALPHNRAEPAPGNICRTAAVHPGEVRAEDKNLIRPQLRNVFRGIDRPSVSFHSHRLFFKDKHFFHLL